MGGLRDGNPPAGPSQEGNVGGWRPTPTPRRGRSGNIYLVMVEDGTFFYTELNGFDMIFRGREQGIESI
ncbi:MAG: hypothetical protein F6K48_23930 [Okeania sp. SIO3H1]|nr:hypothetical protein [Okeania sp. SIO3H1]